MASSFHTRSNSLPSKPHPFTSQIDEHLNIVKSSESTSTSSSSISHNLNMLQDMYDCVDKLIQLPLTQQSLAQKKHKRCVQELLDGSLMLLDMCTIANDSLAHIKESTLELQSILRRRHGGELNIDEIKKYLNSRKVMKKAIQKALKNLVIKGSCIIDEDHETKAMINMLKEVEEVTSTVFKSLLSMLEASQSKASGWSKVSNLMKSKKITCEKDLSEFAKVDVAIVSLISGRKNKSDDISHIQNQLKDQEMCIQDFEEEIESMSRRLIKSRVSLLNILNN